MGTRSQVRTGESLYLRCTLTDGSGDRVNADSAPLVYIYSSAVASETITAETEAGTFTSATAGPFTSTNVATGFYEYQYTVTSGSTDEGLWTDVWVSTIDTQTVNQYLTFDVTIPGSISIEAQSLSQNKLVIVEIDSSVADTSGNTLSADQVIYFLTELNPFYASPDLVRGEVGAAIDYIDDITLSLCIHVSSKKADYIKPTSTSYGARLDEALTYFVIYDAALRGIHLAEETIYNASAGDKVTLGDFSVNKSGGSSPGVSKHLTELKQRLAELREDWFVVVQAGGSLAPGQSYESQTAVRGRYTPDRRRGGRNWLDPRYHQYDVPALNTTLSPDDGGFNKQGYDSSHRSGAMNSDWELS